MGESDRWNCLCLMRFWYLLMVQVYESVRRLSNDSAVTALRHNCSIGNR